MTPPPDHCGIPAVDAERAARIERMLSTARGRPCAVRVRHDGAAYNARVYVWWHELAEWIGHGFERPTAREKERDAVAVLETRVREAIDAEARGHRANGVTAREAVVRYTAIAADADTRAAELERILAAG